MSKNTFEMRIPIQKPLAVGLMSKKEQRTWIRLGFKKNQQDLCLGKEKVVNQGKDRTTAFILVLVNHLWRSIYSASPELLSRRSSEVSDLARFFTSPAARERIGNLLMERTTGIGPASKAWEAFVLPLNYVRMKLTRKIISYYFWFGNGLLLF